MTQNVPGGTAPFANASRLVHREAGDTLPRPDSAHRPYYSTASVLFVLLAALLAALIASPPAALADLLPYERSVESYSIPDVVLINQRGEKVRLHSLLGSGKTVIVDFIYGTCTTICPVLSAGFVNLQAKLGPDRDRVALLSITIDPENDTPTVLRDYLVRYNAKPGWDFLTGSRRDIDNVMRAFNAFMPNKMSHLPLNFILPPKADKWVRINGLLSGKDFLREIKEASKL